MYIKMKIFDFKFLLMNLLMNFPFIFSGGDQAMSGQIGYQAGAGYAFTGTISADLQYRDLKMKGSINSPPLVLTIDQAHFSGFLLTLHYLLK